MRKKLGLKVLGLVTVLLLLAVNCAEEGTAPDANIPPNTFITNFQVDIAPDSATTYNARTYWSGSDVDGAVYWYEWRIKKYDSAAPGDSIMYWYVENDDETVDTLDLTNDWQVTNTQTESFRLDFSRFDLKYIFYVRALDNDLAYDATPAMDTISIARVHSYNYAPQTEIVTGPPTGAVCGEGIYFQLKGTDIDGVVDTFAYKTDDDSVWTKIPGDVIAGSIELNLRDLNTGARTISFKAIDNFRKEDPTPASVSVIVVDTLEPELSVSITDGFKYWVPGSDPQTDVELELSATIDFYYSAIDSFILDTGTEQINLTTTSYTFEALEEGNYSFEATAYDIGGNSTSSGTVSFSVNALSAGHGVLCVNGVDWETYTTEAEDLWESGAPWGNRNSYKCWDLFSGTTAGSAFTDSLLGTGSPPLWMIDTLYFDAISWMWNTYSGDDAYWYDEDFQAALMDYLASGGNILITGRYGSYIFDDEDIGASAEFAEYCQYEGSIASGTIGYAAAVHDSVSDITAGGSLAATYCITVSHPNVVQLWETDGGDAGLGWAIIPNGAGGGGAVAFIGGRSYRYDNTDYKAGIDVIHRYFFGISN